MHFEILVEDQSGKVALDILVPKIVGADHTFIVHSYKGIGRIPSNMRDCKHASKRMLMDNLPKLLKGYGRTQAGRLGFPSLVVLICDLDDNCLRGFRQEFLAILDSCHPKPRARFCLAVEEGEAWFLGDLPAVKRAYPNASDSVLGSYANDSICGTWERLADAICPGGSLALSANGWQAVGAGKSAWSKRIPPHMEIDRNLSPSFCFFRKTLMAEIGIIEETP